MLEQLEKSQQSLLTLHSETQQIRKAGELSIPRQCFTGEDFVKKKRQATFFFLCVSVMTIEINISKTGNKKLQTIRGDPQALKQQPTQTQGYKNKAHILSCKKKKKRKKVLEKVAFLSASLEGHQTTVHTPHYAHVCIHQYSFMDIFCLSLFKTFQETVKTVFSEDG